MAFLRSADFNSGLYVSGVCTTNDAVVPTCILFALHFALGSVEHDLWIVMPNFSYAIDLCVQKATAHAFGEFLYNAE